MQREVGLEGLVVHVKTHFFHFFRRVAHVPTAQFRQVEVLRRKFAQFHGFAFGNRLRFLGQVQQKFAHGLRALGHPFFEHKVCVRGVPQQLGALAAQAHQFRHHRARVVGISAVAALPKGAPQVFSTGPVVAVGQVRQVRRRVQCEQPARLFPGCASGLFGRRQGLCGNSRNFFRCRAVVRKALQVRQILLAKTQGSQAQGFVQGAQLLLTGSVQKGAVAHKTLVGQLQQALLLRIQRAVRCVVNGANARKELWIQADVVAQGTQRGRESLR